MLAHQTFGTSGEKAMIVHGLYGSGRNWGVIAKRLSDAFQVVTPDLRNHGNSFHDPDHSYAALAADLAALIEQIGAPMHLCGHSMGGKAAMTLALTRPELIDRLVIADIAPVTYTHSQIHHIAAMRAVDLDAVSRRSDAEAMLKAQGTAPELRSFFTQSLDVANKRWRLNLDALETNMPAILSFPDSLSGPYTGDVLFLSGAKSDYVGREHRAPIKALFPNAKFARIPDTGHWLHAEKPRAFEASLRAYFGG